MSYINIVVYVKDNLPSEEYKKLKGFKLIQLIRHIGVDVGKVHEVDDHIVAIYETDNFVAAKIKNYINKQIFSVETFAELHHKVHNVPKPIH